MVDDDASIRRALGVELQILEFEVLVLQRAEELLASEFPPDNACPLLDVCMPGMSGIELCRSLATSERHLPTLDPLLDRFYSSGMRVFSSKYSTLKLRRHYRKYPISTMRVLGFGPMFFTTRDDTRSGSRTDSE